MKVLLAPDKFKGSLTAAQVASHLGRGLAARGIDFDSLPLADGGDGSVAAAIHAGFGPVAITVTGPTGLPRTTQIADDGHTCVVEVADTCGLAALPGGVLAPMTSASRGLGDAVWAAVHLGAHRIVLALGGSASTDGGAGLLAGLGMQFLDVDGHPINVNGGALHRIHDVDSTGLLDLSGVEIILASDVQNPLTGPDGAAAVYGPQKGATPADVQTLDAGLAHLVQCLGIAGYPDAERCAATPGAGAAGGLGFAGMLLGGRCVSGADYFLDLLDFESHLPGCDLVITGEGRMDNQTLEGKLPAVVAQRAGNIPVIAVVGRSDISDAGLARMGIEAVHAIVDHTDHNPAGDPALTQELLEQLGRTIPLPRQRTTPAAARVAAEAPAIPVTT